jgi:predicted anti-sigma-YlaC factor YlaD
MRHTFVRPHRCDYARQAVSLRLDGELSAFELVLLEGHLGKCADCRAFAAEVAPITEVVRATALEPVERPFELPRRRTGATRTRVLSAAAAAAVVVVGLGTLGGTTARDQERLQFQPTRAQLNSIQNDDVLVRAFQHSPSPPPPPPQIGIGTSV